MGICIAVFIVDLITALILTGGRSWTGILAYYGMKSNRAISAGQLWRLLTAVFLHADLTHIGFNMYALFIWGKYAEALYGKARFVALFLLAGLMGTAASYAFNDANSLGASGAIYGLFGALLYFRKYDKTMFTRVFGTQILIYIGISLALGFFSAYIDNTGHVGGLAGGYLAARSVGLLSERHQRTRRGLFAAIYAAVFLLLIAIGFYF